MCCKKLPDYLFTPYWSCRWFQQFTLAWLEENERFALDFLVKAYEKDKENEVSTVHGLITAADNWSSLRCFLLFAVPARLGEGSFFLLRGRHLLTIESKS